MNLMLSVFLFIGLAGKSLPKKLTELAQNWFSMLTALVFVSLSLLPYEQSSFHSL